MCYSQGFFFRFKHSLIVSHRVNPELAAFSTASALFSICRQTTNKQNSRNALLVCVSACVSFFEGMGNLICHINTRLLALLSCFHICCSYGVFVVIFFLFLLVCFFFFHIRLICSSRWLAQILSLVLCEHLRAGPLPCSGVSVPTQIKHPQSKPSPALSWCFGVYWRSGAPPQKQLHPPPLFSLCTCLRSRCPQQLA